MQSTDPPWESSAADDEEVLADLAARREALKVLIHELHVSEPSLVPSMVGLLLSTVVFLAAAALLVGPYLRPQLPPVLSTIAAFLLVVAVCALYLAFRRFSVDYERRRLHRTVLGRADYLAHTADELLRDSPSGSRT